MIYSYSLCKDKQEDAGPPLCFSLLSEQDLVRHEDPGIALTTALSSKWRGCAVKPAGALPHT